ncbi:MAG TPA: PhnD/SsuA/transferrin family substrate-binding protein [Acidimicrobiia bacterium]|nr:PhnD/SsuA/transferrin family substrate-binding protein [Acidimicrobiia bacterium]
MKRRLWALLAVLVLLVAACGDDGADETTTTEAPAATTTTEAAPEETTTTEADETSDWPDTLVFGFVPSREAEDLQDNVDVLAGILSDALDIDVEGVVTTDYTALGAALGTGQAQIGALAPANYVIAARQYDNIELLAQSVRFGDSTYHAQYFTNDPSVCTGDPVEGAYYYDDEGNVEFREPTDTPALQVGWNPDGTRDESVSAGLVCPEPVDLSVVEGGHMSFGTETSTSGFIFPVLELGGVGLTQDVDYTSSYSGSHDNSVLDVYNGDADFGVSFDDARRNVREENPDVGERVIVFNISSPIANDVIAVDANLPDDLKDAIFNAIVDFVNTEDGAALMDEVYSWTDLTRADEFTEASFVLIEQALDELGFGQ